MTGYQPGGMIPGLDALKAVPMYANPMLSGAGSAHAFARWLDSLERGLAAGDPRGVRS